MNRKTLAYFVLLFTSFSLFAQNVRQHHVLFNDVDGFSGYVTFESVYEGFARQLKGRKGLLVLTKYSTSRENLETLNNAGIDLRGFPSSRHTPEKYSFVVEGRAEMEVLTFYGSNEYKATERSRLQISNTLGDMTTPSFSKQYEEAVSKWQRENEGKSFWEREGDFKYIKVVTLYLTDFKNLIDKILRESKEKEEEEKKDKEEEEKPEKQKKVDDKKAEDDFWNTGNNPKKETSASKKRTDDFWSTGTNPSTSGQSNAPESKSGDFWSGSAYTYFELNNPQESYSTDQGFYTISGKVFSNEQSLNALVIGEDYSHPIDVSSKSFSVSLLLKAGLNRFTIKLNDYEKVVTVMCNRRPVKLRASLVWNTSGSDIDLKMTNPQGEECSYQRKSVGNMNLDVDNTSGYGPENIYVNGITSGTYTIRIHNYSRGEGTHATVYIFVDEKLVQTKKLSFSSSKEYIQVSTLDF